MKTKLLNLWLLLTLVSRPVWDLSRFSLVFSSAWRRSADPISCCSSFWRFSRINVTLDVMREWFRMDLTTLRHMIPHGSHVSDGGSRWVGFWISWFSPCWVRPGTPQVAWYFHQLGRPMSIQSTLWYGQSRPHLHTPSPDNEFLRSETCILFSCSWGGSIHQWTDSDWSTFYVTLSVTKPIKLVMT